VGQFRGREEVLREERERLRKEIQQLRAGGSAPPSGVHTKMYKPTGGKAGKYEGELDSNGFPDGLGVLKNMGDGALLYEGSWRAGKFHGEGTKFFDDDPSKMEYTGWWKDGKRDGVGKSFLRSGAMEYYGEWEADEYHGHGTKYHRGGVQKEYEGQWQQGMYHGEGIKYRPGGMAEYEGQWHQGVYHGEGTLYDDSGWETYTGRWTKGHRDPIPIDLSLYSIFIFYSYGQDRLDSQSFVRLLADAKVLGDRPRLSSSDVNRIFAESTEEGTLGITFADFEEKLSAIAQKYGFSIEGIRQQIMSTLAFTPGSTVGRLTNAQIAEFKQAFEECAAFIRRASGTVSDRNDSD